VACRSDPPEGERPGRRPGTRGPDPPAVLARASGGMPIEAPGVESPTRPDRSAVTRTDRVGECHMSG